MAWWGWLLTSLGAWLTLSVVTLGAFAIGAHLGRARAGISLLRGDERRSLDAHRWN